MRFGALFLSTKGFQRKPRFVCASRINTGLCRKHGIAPGETRHAENRTPSFLPCCCCFPSLHCLLLSNSCRPSPLWRHSFMCFSVYNVRKRSPRGVLCLFRGILDLKRDAFSFSADAPLAGIVSQFAEENYSFRFYVTTSAFTTRTFSIEV